MSIMDFVTFLKGLGITTPIFTDSFPMDSPVESMTVEIGNDFGSRGSVYNSTLTITVRSDMKSKAEQKSIELIGMLKNLTNAEVGNSQIIMIKSQQIVPSYLGKDENNQHYYMNNFRLLVTD